MSWAVDNEGKPVALEQGANATCATCRGHLRAHCGELRIWHWHHEGTDCDPWHEPETDWHVSWKNLFDEEWREVTEGPHRADVMTNRGLVIEFQHSSLSPDEYREREDFWGGLVWVIDAREWFCNLSVRMRPKDFSFRWKHPRQSMFAAKRPLFLDTGSELFQILFLGRDVPCGGIGRFIPKNIFVRAMHKADPTKLT